MDIWIAFWIGFYKKALMNISSKSPSKNIHFSGDQFLRVKYLCY